MADDAALIAHILRRLTFGPHPGQVDDLLPLGVSGTIDRLLGAEPLTPEEPQLGTGGDYDLLRAWWLNVLAGPDAGLHERMVWFWHSHLTSSLEKCEPALMITQHRLVRKLALGNFRELLQKITIDGAMLAWLDGAGSTADAPNENYSRELMELFALGRGNYTEADVRAGSVAFSGWGINDNGSTIAFDPKVAATTPVEFLGKQVLHAEDAVNAVCDNAACAPFIAGKIHRYLMGIDPDDTRRAELASIFRDNSFEIRPLVEAIVRHPSFLEARMNRPRAGVEWFIAAQAVLGATFEEYRLGHLGQQPFVPPNVAGWPGDDRWVSAGAVMAKVSAARDYSDDTPTFDSDDPVAEVLTKASLYEVSAETRAALTAAIDGLEGRRETSTLLHALVLCTPEFNLA